MNCKPGDKCEIINALDAKQAKAIKGRIVVVTHLHAAPEFQEMKCWAYEGKKFKWFDGTHQSQAAIPDAWLRPIRPGDLEDETPAVRELEAV